MAVIKWAKARCPECGREYEYTEGGYKPQTCNNFECLWKHNHPKIKGVRHGR